MSHVCLHWASSCVWPSHVVGCMPSPVGTGVGTFVLSTTVSCFLFFLPGVLLSQIRCHTLCWDLNLRALLQEELQSHQIQDYAVVSISHKNTQREGASFEENELCLLFLVSSLCVCSLRYQHFFFFCLYCFWLYKLKYVLTYWIIIINCGQLWIDCRGEAGSIRELICS